MGFGAIKKTIFGWRKKTVKNPTGNGQGRLGLGGIDVPTHPLPRISLNTPIGMI